MNRDQDSDQKKLDRAEHLAELSRDIQNWKTDVERLELDGQTDRASAMRRWIKSAERLAELLRQMPNT
jgi:hypothetical protein